MKIAVLSDQHIDCEAEPASWDLAREAFKAAVKAKADHVVLVGDTFDCASAMERDRERVEKYLRKIGLWSADRLTVVVGNHDIFHTPHRGGLVRRALEFAKAATADAQESYDTFCDWAGQLARAEHLLAGDDDLFPLAKDLGDTMLLAADTTSATTGHSANGFWRKKDDARLHAVRIRRGQSSVLAIHNAPFQSSLFSINDWIGGEDVAGFPAADFRRLERFADKRKLDTIVCGHIHAMGEDDPWEWTVGKQATAYLMGRTGGVHESEPVIGILTALADGSTRWKEIEL